MIRKLLLLKISILVFVGVAHADNTISIEQVGDNVTLELVQDGSRNTITGLTTTSKLDGDNMDVSIKQYGNDHVAKGNVDGYDNTLNSYQGNGQDNNTIHAEVIGDYNSLDVRQGKHMDGTTDDDETGDHEAYWTVTGDSNTLVSAQTDVNRGGGGGAGHYLNNTITGDSNILNHTQMGKAGHTGYVDISGSSNTVDLYQRGNGGQKTADIDLSGDGHSVDISQRGSNSASATVDLTNGGGGYDFTLSQDVTTSPASYSLTGTCVTISGCTVSVNQSN